MKHKIIIVAGARPNFMKISPIINELDKRKVKFEYRIVHTGQHYDKKMSEDFFKELNIPSPHINLNAKIGSQAIQTSSIIESFEKYLIEEKNIKLVIVVGDVNSTMACAISAKKLNILVAHVEAGIRSYDRTMPEEINRLIVDSISDIFFVTTKNAQKILIEEGKNPKDIYLVGNTMIDTLFLNKPRFIEPDIFKKNKLEVKNYVVITLHRPSNVDNPEKLYQILNSIKYKSKVNLVFVVHPRTLKIIKDSNIDTQGFIIVSSLSYLRFNYLVSNSMCVITDSGGITEETTVLGIPCITLRENTERPETVEIGTNILLGNNYEKIHMYLELAKLNKWKKHSVPKYWDGKTSKRIVDILEMDKIYE